MSNMQMGLLDFHKIHKDLAKNEIILDVRTRDEFAQGHIAGAMNVPVDEVAAKAPSLKPYAKIYIHCKRGGRAKTAFAQLSQQGLDNLVCIHDGGIDQWIENGFSVEI